MKYVFFGSPPLAVTILKRLVNEGHMPELIITQKAKEKGRQRTKKTGKKNVPSRLSVART